MSLYWWGGDSRVAHLLRPRWCGAWGGEGPSDRRRATLADLPLTAQAAISTAIGRDQTSYHAVATEVRAGGPGTQQVGGGYRFKNRPHALEAEFTAAEVTVQSGGAALGIEFLGYGYGSSVQAVVAAEPRAEAKRVEYRRGEVTEWYVNGPLGLEQGFTLARAPDRGEGAEPLAILLGLKGNWSAEVDEEAKGAMLAHADESVLRYRGIVAYDARGKELPA